MIRVLFLLGLISLTSCTPSKKTPEKELENAKQYFSPLKDYRSVTCEIGLNLPESFKSLKRQQLDGDELKSWNRLFSKLETHVFRWSTSSASCWFHGMRKLKSDLKPNEVQDQFLSSLDAQIKVGSCVLLEAFFYNSPFEDISLEHYKLIPAEEEEGFVLNSYFKKSQIFWNSKLNQLKSVTASGERLSGIYEAGKHQPLLQRASILSGSNEVVIEDLKLDLLEPQNRSLVSELLISLKQGESPSTPQAQLQFKHCVASISKRPQLPEEE